MELPGLRKRAKTPTKSMNSLRNTQKYIKGNSSLFSLLIKRLKRTIFFVRRPQYYISHTMPQWSLVTRYWLARFHPRNVSLEHLCCHRLPQGVRAQANQGNTSGNTRRCIGFCAPGKGEIHVIILRKGVGNSKFCIIIHGNHNVATGVYYFTQPIYVGIGNTKLRKGKCAFSSHRNRWCPGDDSLEDWEWMTCQNVVRQNGVGLQKKGSANGLLNKASSLRAHHAFYYTTTTWKCLISRFMEDINEQRRNFLSLSKLECSPQEINSRKICPH